MIAAAEKFLAKHLGGLFQESMTDAVATRLKEITVDPKTVTLEAKTETKTETKEETEISGKWTVFADAPGQVVQILMELKQNGNNFDGTLSSQLGGGTVENGKLEGTKFTGVAKLNVQGEPIELKMEGRVNGDEMTGTFDSPFGLIPFTAKRQK
jgi:hypothetical protein